MIFRTRVQMKNEGKKSMGGSGYNQQVMRG